MIPQGYRTFLVVMAAACVHACPACPPCPLGAPGLAAEVHPIKLPHCGPEPAPLPVINLPHQVQPTIENPPISLPAAIPSTKTVAHVCHGTKTIVKPQVYQQVIIVPYYYRYLRTTYKPVVETINYKHTLPCCPPEPYVPPCNYPCAPNPCS